MLQNIILPMDFARKYLTKERVDRAIQLLESVSLADRAHKLPGQVPGGEQQRAAIAWALAGDSPLVVADEPTGILNSRAGDEVFYLFRDLVQQEKTLLMVTHDKELARRVLRVIEIINGNITRDEYFGGVV